MSLLTELDAFYLDHRRCGELEAGIERSVVGIACDCGASMVRPAGKGDGAAGRGSQRAEELDVSVGT